MKAEATAGTESKRRREHSAKEKAQAVLALWSGRRTPSALSKELELPWAVINMWERRALSGMLTALDPNWKQAGEERPSLPQRVERLIEQTLKPATVEAPAAN